MRIALALKTNAADDDENNGNDLNPIQRLFEDNDIRQNDKYRSDTRRYHVNKTCFKFF